MSCHDNYIALDFSQIIVFRTSRPYSDTKPLAVKQTKSAMNRFNLVKNFLKLKKGHIEINKE